MFYQKFPVMQALLYKPSKEMYRCFNAKKTQMSDNLSLEDFGILL